MKATVAFLVLILVIGFTAPVFAAQADQDIEKAVAELMSKMTLKEKIGQLNQYSSTFDITGPRPGDAAGAARFDQIKSGMVGSMLNVTGAKETRRAQELAVKNSRLGIPMIFAFDVIHGYRTMFPIPLAEAASWDMDALELSARIAAKEASAAGLHWTFAPMVDISRDARWGRVMEGAGEDPYLGSLAAVARIKGFQGDDLSKLDTIAACAKHFAAYGFAEGGRDYNTVDISDHTLHNVILPPFKAAVDANVATFMNGFNEIGGIPVTASRELQRTILKGDWNYQGMMVSDWGSIAELVPHGVAANKKHAAMLAITAGSDMDMEGEAYVAHLEELVTSGMVSEVFIDDAVKRVLTLKFKIGLFDDPYKYSNEQREKDTLYTAEHLAAAREVGRKSIVLLKNDKNLLPLKKEGSIAVIGALAADKDSPLGSWRGKAVANSAVSLLEGIQAAVGDSVEVTYTKGADLGKGVRSFINELEINEDDRSGFAKAVAAAKAADRVVIALGEEAFQSGEGRSQVDIGFKGVQLDLLKAVHEANPNVVLVLMNGRPLVLTWPDENVPAILETWHLGSQAGHAIADVLFGDHSPSGRLPVSFPRHVGQMPLYYNYKNTGRPGPEPNGLVFWSHYTDEKNDPLYPFGYGLTYSSFKYSKLKISTEQMAFDGKLTASVQLKNTGKREATETVQLYIRDLVGTVTRPVKELKSFQQITLKPGQSKKVSFTLTAKDLAFYNIENKWTTEPGGFVVMIGPNARDVQGLPFALQPPTASGGR